MSIAWVSALTGLSSFVCSLGERDLTDLNSVYSSPTGVHFTFRVSDDAMAPTRCGMQSIRWDDAAFPSGAQIEVGVMQQHPVDGRHGFVFHEACWGLLKDVYHNHPIPLSSLQIYTYSNYRFFFFFFGRIIMEV